VSILQSIRDRAHELGKFGTVGLAGVFVDAGTFNLLLLGPLAAEQKVITAKVIATIVAIIFAWVSHRLWTFSDRRALHPLREFIVFGAVNGFALVIQAGVLAVSHYALGFTSNLADNVAAYAVGLPLGTIARYVGYRMFVFTGVASSRPAHEEPPK
jgi:putative flippase GtrA